MKTSFAALLVLFAMGFPAMGSPENSDYDYPAPCCANPTARTLFLLHRSMGSLMDRLHWELRRDPFGGNYTLQTRNIMPSGAVLLPGIPSHIQLDSIWIMGNGTVGWANSNPGFGDNINYGRLYVYGIQIPQGVPWIGNVFPTDKTVSWGGLTLPCFAVTPGLAEIISNQPR